MRAYRREDLPAIFALDEICFAPAFRFSLAAMRRFAEARNALTVVAESESGVAGFCIAHVERVRGERVGYIVTLDVAPEARRHGLARRMMLQIEDEARDAGCGTMGLHVSVENESAMLFYEREGYVRTHTVADFYGPELDAYVYEKTIKSPLSAVDAAR